VSELIEHLTSELSFEFSSDSSELVSSLGITKSITVATADPTTLGQSRSSVLMAQIEHSGLASALGTHTPATFAQT
jgi:hypothetical protein